LIYHGTFDLASQSAPRLLTRDSFHNVQYSELDYVRASAMAGLKAHPSLIHRVAATSLGASMWFFLMYRAKKDGPVLLGWKHPWDH
ncbi:hypothetical protein B0H63DRAFT_238697, partial [Podospora didyma]